MKIEHVLFLNSRDLLYPASDDRRIIHALPYVHYRAFSSLMGRGWGQTSDWWRPVTFGLKIEPKNLSPDKKPSPKISVSIKNRPPE